MRPLSRKLILSAVTILIEEFKPFNPDLPSDLRTIMRTLRITKKQTISPEDNTYIFH